MDLIYTDYNVNAATKPDRRTEQGVLSAYQLDMSFGASENNFELTLKEDQAIQSGAYIFIDGTEYGGIVDGVKASSGSKTVTYHGRTWHGILNSKIISPDIAADYLYVSGDANEVLARLITSLHLGLLFSVPEEESRITIDNYRFERYVKAYDAISRMLGAHNAKLKFKWVNDRVVLRVEHKVDYADDCLDEYTSDISIEKTQNKVNHLICLGSGDLSDRTVIHLYVDGYGAISNTQYYTGVDDITEVYDYPNAESEDDLRANGRKRLNELRQTDKSELFVNEDSGSNYDIGDKITAIEPKTGTRIGEYVTQKIVRIQNGVVRTEYKTGGKT